MPGPCCNLGGSKRIHAFSHSRITPQSTMPLSKFARFALRRANGTMLIEPWIETHSRYRHPVLLGRQAAMKQVRGFCCYPVAPFYHISCPPHPDFSVPDQPYGSSSECILLLEKLLESFHPGPLLHGEYPTFVRISWHCSPCLRSD